MATGKADAQKMYFGGKLKISGNMMAAQKLTWLKEIDKEAAAKAYAAQGGATTSAPAAAAVAATKASAVIDALRDRIAKNPNLAKEFGAIYQLVVDGKGVVVDLKSGALRDGNDASAAVTLKLEGDDLVALAKGQASVQDLYQRGKLRVDGDVNLAHKLGFLNQLV